MDAGIFGRSGFNPGEDLINYRAAGVISARMDFCYCVCAVAAGMSDSPLSGSGA
jgi:hypothetical protein